MKVKTTAKLSDLILKENYFQIGFMLLEFQSQL